MAEKIVGETEQVEEAVVCETTTETLQDTQTTQSAEELREVEISSSVESADAVPPADKEAGAVPPSDKAAPKPKGNIRGMQCLSRGVALFLGLFTLAACVGYLMGNGGDESIWMIDFTILHDSGNPKLVGTVIRNIGMIATPISGIMLVLWALKPVCSSIRKILTVCSLVLLALISMQNAGDYWFLAAYRVLHIQVLVPPSLIYALLFTLLAWRIAMSDKYKAQTHLVTLACIAGCALVAALLFPLAEIGLFGTIDHSRLSDAVIVFDEQPQKDGKLSKTATAPIKEAADLYDKKLAPKVIISSKSGSKETCEAIESYAKKLGVSSNDILVDHNGGSVEDAVVNSLKIAKKHSFKTLLVASNFYDLSSISMLYKAHGKTVYTIPAMKGKSGVDMVTAMLAEIPAWWSSWFKNAVLS